EIFRSAIAMSWSAPRPMLRLSGPSWTTRSPCERDLMTSLGAAATLEVLARLLDLLLERLEATRARVVGPEAVHLRLRGALELELELELLPLLHVELDRPHVVLGLEPQVVGERAGERPEALEHLLELGERLLEHLVLGAERLLVGDAVDARDRVRAPREVGGERLVGGERELRELDAAVVGLARLVDALRLRGAGRDRLRRRRVALEPGHVARGSAAVAGEAAASALARIGGAARAALVRV